MLVVRLAPTIALPLTSETDAEFAVVCAFSEGKVDEGKGFVTAAFRAACSA